MNLKEPIETWLSGKVRDFEELITYEQGESIWLCDEHQSFETLVDFWYYDTSGRTKVYQYPGTLKQFIEEL